MPRQHAHECAHLDGAPSGGSVCVPLLSDGPSARFCAIFSYFPFFILKTALALLCIFVFRRACAVFSLCRSFPFPCSSRIIAIGSCVSRSVARLGTARTCRAERGTRDKRRQSRRSDERRWHWTGTGAPEPTNPTQRVAARYAKKERPLTERERDRRSLFLAASHRRAAQTQKGEHPTAHRGSRRGAHARHAPHSWR